MPAAAILAILVVVVGVVVVQGAVGEERSAAAVCDVFETEGAELHDRFQGRADALEQDVNGEQLLGGIGEILAAPGRISQLMAKMAAVAPKDIEPAFRALAESFGKVAETAGENATNPLAGLVGGIALGAQVQGPWEDANEYLREHCARPA